MIDRTWMFLPAGAALVTVIAFGAFLRSGGGAGAAARDDRRHGRGDADGHRRMMLVGITATVVRELCASGFALAWWARRGAGKA